MGVSWGLANPSKGTWSGGTGGVGGEGASVKMRRVGAEDPSITNLFFFVALLTEILAPASHFCTPHGMFFGCKVLFDLRFC